MFVALRGSPRRGSLPSAARRLKSVSTSLGPPFSNCADTDHPKNREHYLQCRLWVRDIAVKSSMNFQRLQ